jgi:hypothetical protein
MIDFFGFKAMLFDVLDVSTGCRIPDHAAPSHDAVPFAPLALFYAAGRFYAGASARPNGRANLFSLP